MVVRTSRLHAVGRPDPSGTEGILVARDVREPRFNPNRRPSRSTTSAAEHRLYAEGDLTAVRNGLIMDSPVIARSLRPNGQRAG